DQDYYDSFDIGAGATTEEIKTASRSLAKKYHPVVAHDDGEESINADNFSLISEAYEILIDPESRSQYDRVKAIMKIESVEALKDIDIDEGTGAVFTLTRFFTDNLKHKSSELELQYQIERLDLNSFYEISIYIITIIKQHSII